MRNEKMEKIEIGWRGRSDEPKVNIWPLFPSSGELTNASENETRLLYRDAQRGGYKNVQTTDNRNSNTAKNDIIQEQAQAQPKLVEQTCAIGTRTVEKCYVSNNQPS